MLRPERRPARAGTVLAVVSAAVFLANLDLFIVNIAFPAIAAEFGGDLGALSWVLNAYTVVFAALLAATGRLADRYGRRRLFLLGVVVFGLASAACAAAPTIGALVAFRAVQAVGAALVVPTSLALVFGAYGPERRATAVGVWSAVGGTAAALGPLIGALLVQGSWRWIFLVNVPVAAVALAAGASVLTEVRDTAAGLPDLPGTAVLVAGVGALAWAVVDAPDRGWAHPATLGLLAAAAAALAAVVARSARHPAPVLDLVALRVPAFRLACAAMLLYGTAFAMMLFGCVLVMTSLWGWSVPHAGLALAPGPTAAAVSSVAASYVVRRAGPGVAAAAGCAVFGASVASWVLFVGPAPHYAALLPGLVACGVGVGLTLPSLSGAPGATLPPARWGAGSSAVNCVRQVGTVLGTSLVVLFVGAGADVDDFRAAWTCTAAVCVLGAAAAGGVALRSGGHAP